MSQELFMDNNNIICTLINQPFREKIIKALLFHCLLLLCTIIGIIYQQQFPSTQLAKDIPFYYWLFLCIVPMGYTLSEIEEETRETLPPDLQKPEWKHARPRCKLHDLSFIKTFRLFFRDCWWLKKLMVCFMMIFFAIAVLEHVKKHPHFPLLWFMGIVSLFMLCRYIYVLYKIPTTHIILTEEKLMLPVFGLTGIYDTCLAWNDIKEMEIIGSSHMLYTYRLEELYADPHDPMKTLQKNTAFIRGIILHYTKNNKQKMCTITDNMLDAISLWKLYTYYRNYIKQEDLILRLTYGTSPIYVHWPDETGESAKVIAKICLDEASKINRLPPLT